MRVATWNMEGRGSGRHVAFLAELACDVLLLTEVPRHLDVGHGSLARSAPMAVNKDWSAVWTALPASPVHAPSIATAAVQLAGLAVVCTVLPWKGAGPYWPGAGADTGARTAAALKEITPLLRGGAAGVVFGGDFNHALVGREVAGSLTGRHAINELLLSHGLRAATAELPHRENGISSIDHVAIPSGWTVTSAERVVAADPRGRLSDHDAYVVETTPGS